MNFWEVALLAYVVVGLLYWISAADAEPAGCISIPLWLPLIVLLDFVPVVFDRFWDWWREKVMREERW